MQNKIDPVTNAQVCQRKEWQPPTLRRLVISATASGAQHNEGQGQGKGMSGTQPS